MLFRYVTLDIWSKKKTQMTYSKQWGKLSYLEPTFLFYIFQISLPKRKITLWMILIFFSAMFAWSRIVLVFFYCQLTENFADGQICWMPRPDSCQPRPIGYSEPSKTTLYEQWKEWYTEMYSVGNNNIDFKYSPNQYEILLVFRRVCSWSPFPSRSMLR